MLDEVGGFDRRKGIVLRKAWCSVEEGDERGKEVRWRKGRRA